MNKGRKLLLASAALALTCSTPAQAVLNDIAVFAPGVDNDMTAQQQNDVASYLTDPARLPQAAVYAAANQADLVTWMNARMADGKSDVLLVVDMAPALVYSGNDESLAEQWIENGNMLIWTGSMPFRASVDAAGVKTMDGDISTVLDIDFDNYGTSFLAGQPYPSQRHTSVSSDEPGFYNYLPSLNLNYNTSTMLNYGAVYAHSMSVTGWDDAPEMVIDEIFAESDGNSIVKYRYASDAIVLTMRSSENDRQGLGGQYAQFYTGNGLVDGQPANTYRNPVLYEFLHNWVDSDINLIHVQAGATNGDGSAASPFGTIQEGIDAARQFSRDRVIVAPGVYNETLVMKRSVKLISAGDDQPGGSPGYLDDFGHPELEYTYNTFTKADSKHALARAEATIIDGTGQAAASMITVPAGAGLGTWIDGFTIRNMPDTDTTVCGHPHAVDMAGASPLVINSVLQDNGSGGLSSRALFAVNSNGVPVDDNPCANDDFSSANVLYDSHPALVNNIVSSSKGANISCDNYAYPIIAHNESFRSGYYGTDMPRSDIEAPGIGIRHGASPLVSGNTVYDSSWAGIGARRGANELTWVKGIDRGTAPLVLDNYVFNSGTAGVEDAGAGIGALNTGSGTGHVPDAYHFIQRNFIYNSAEAAIGCSYMPDEDGETTTVPRDSVGFVFVHSNTGVGSGHAGLGLHGTTGTEWIIHNEFADNARAGIGMKDDAWAGTIFGNLLRDNEMAGIGLKSGADVEEIYNNVLSGNQLAGIGMFGYNDDGSENIVTAGLVNFNTIEWNAAAGIGMQHGRIDQVGGNEIRFNALPGITVTDNSQVGDGNLGWIIANHLEANGRGDLHGTGVFTAGLVVSGEGSVAYLYDTVIEQSGAVNMVVHPDSSATVADCTLRDNRYNADDFAADVIVPPGGPNLEVEGTATVSNSMFDNSAGPGLAMFNDAQVSLEGTTISGSSVVGIVVGGGASFTSFSNNTITGNDTTGLAVYEHGGPLNIENSSISGNAAAGMMIENITGPLTITDSEVIGNGTAGIVSGQYPLDVTLDGVQLKNNGTLGIKVVGSDLAMNDVFVSGNGTLNIWTIDSDLTLSNSVVENNGLIQDTRTPYASVINISNTEYHETALVVSGGQSVTVTGCDFDSWSKTEGIHIDDADAVYVSGNTVKAWSVGVGLKRVGWADIDGNHLIARWPVALVETDAAVTNNTSGPVSDGYQFTDSTVAYLHNTFYGGTGTPGGRFAVHAHGASVIDAYNNIITGTQFALSANSGAVINADYNLMGICRFTYVTWGGSGTVNWGPNNLFQVDPKLVDPANNDFHIAADSPAVDAGSNAFQVDIDMEGDARPAGSGYDIGADEVN